MKYNIIFFNKNKQVALLETDECYIVANGFKGKDEAWANGNYYTFFDNNKCMALTKALDFYNLKVNDTYISYERLVELCTKFKDGLMEDDKEATMEYINNECDMTEEEKDFFGIKEKRRFTLVDRWTGMPMGETDTDNLRKARRKAVSLQCEIYDRESEKIIFDGGGNGWNDEWCKEHQFDLL